jgi:hypothetical protein
MCQQKDSVHTTSCVTLGDTLTILRPAFYVHLCLFKYDAHTLDTIF